MEQHSIPNLPTGNTDGPASIVDLVAAEGGADIEFEPGRLGLGTRPVEW